MNPLFMQMFMNPMGMGCLPFMGGFNFMMPSMCCGSAFMTMPYYQDDNLWFFNQPVYRDTRYDYLLDPGLALKRAQTSMQNGGGLFGLTPLPGFTFPGVTQTSPINPVNPITGLPGQAQQTTKTEAEKEAEKKTAEETKKPEAKKAQNLNASFAKIKKLAEDKANNFPEIPEELSKKAEEAMKKETAAEQLAAMKEVMDAIPESVLRKTVLADDTVRSMLRRAGYNFNLGKNKYSLKNNDIKDNELDHANIATRLYENITATDSDMNELMRISGQLNNQDVAKAYILGFISSWNDVNKGKEKRLLRVIGANIPTGDRAIGLSKPVKDAVTTITNALLYKANEYKGYPKIDAAAKKVRDALQIVTGENGFKQQNINSLSNAFDELYARLRMQEAASVRDYINKNFKYMNEVKDGIINENIVIEETQQDLKDESISFPKVNELDETPVTDEIIVQTEQEMEDLDEEYEGDGKGMLEALVQNKKLTKVEGKENVYQTVSIKEDGKVRYFGVIDDKVYEVFKKDGKFLRAKGAQEVKAEDIGSYTIAVARANKLVEEKALNYVASLSKVNRYPIFKATGANEFYIIKDNEFYHLLNVDKIYIKRVDNLDKVFIDFKDENRKGVYIYDITADDVEEFSDDKIKTKKQAEDEKKAEELKDVAIVESYTFTSLKDLENNTVLDELSEEATGAKGNIQTTKVAGYFYCKTKNRYYKYDIKTGKLKYMPEIKSINEKGYYINKNNKCVPIAEAFLDKVYTDVEVLNKIQEYGSEFRTHLNGNTSDEEYVQAHRKLNTIIALNNPHYTINFIKGYKNNKCLWSNSGICKQIATENGIEQGDTGHLMTSAYYIKQIAILIKNVVDITTFDRSPSNDDYTTLCKLAKGESMSGAASKLDDIIDKVIEAYDK